MLKISVIVPVYQVEKYLSKCLSSLVNQTLESIEIIIVDDGSRDNSAQIIKEFSNKYPQKIKSFYKENGGLSEARNFGIDHAVGEFIAFVDSDDYVDETMLEEMYLLAVKHGAEMVICNLQKVNEQGSITQKLTQIPNMPERMDLKVHFSIFGDLSYFACNKIFHRSLFDGFRFKKGVHFEDIQLIPQLLLRCKTVAQTQSFHYNYLERLDSITKTHTRQGLDILRAVEDVVQVFRISPFKDQVKSLKDFQILEGVYTFIAYQAFVKNPADFVEMSQELRNFRQKNSLSLSDILFYRRFGKNYLLSLPLKKQFYYVLYFMDAARIFGKLL